MHGKQASLFLILFQITCLQANPLVNITVSENNFFHKINLELHILTNKLFRSLDLSQEFVRNAEIQSILTTHSDLNRLAERHSSACEEIQNITSSQFKNTTELVKLLEEIINEEVNQLGNANSSESVITHSNVTLHQTIHYVYELFDKISELSLKDLATVTNDTQINLNLRKFATPLKSREIKAWRPSESVEDEADNETRRIYRGKKTRIKTYPFLVSIHVMNEFVCAGSIISKELVITAATCLQIAHKNSLDRDIRRTIFVRVGSDYPKRQGELIPIIQIYFHPSYNPDSLNNNIAIIRMMRRLKYSKRRKIERIKYDRDGEFADNVNSISILGWGAKYSTREPSPNPKVSIANLDLYNMEDCSEIYSRYYVTEQTFCAGFVMKGGGACNKDAGGPAIVSDELVGIISFGPIVCGMTDAPTVFAKISSYAKWIDGVIGQGPQMRQPTTNRKKKKLHNLSEEFLTPILTTSNHVNSVTEANKPSTVTTEDLYPDEMVILKELLHQIVLSNNSLMDYILYGDRGNDETAKIETTTTKVIHKAKVEPQLFLNKNLFQQNYNKQPRKKKPLRMFDDIIDSSISYEDVDIEIKILESLVGFSSDDKATTAKFKSDFSQQSEVNKHRMPNKVINNVKYSNEMLSDSSDYYEEVGLSIEVNENMLRSTQDYVHTATTKFHGINLEDYKNIMIYSNPMKESRGIITIDNQEFDENIKKFDHNKKSDTDVTNRITTIKSTTKIKSNQLEDHKDHIIKMNHFRHNREEKDRKEKDKHTSSLSNNEKYVKKDKNIENITKKHQILNKNKEFHNNNFETNKTSKTKPVTQSVDDKTEKNKGENNMPIGKAMAISDEDFEYYDRNIEKQEYTNNIRNRDEDTSKSIFWRFKSSV